jgi:hypothetical protein
VCTVLNLRHLPIAQGDADKRLEPIRKVVNELLALPSDAKPSQSKKSIKAQGSAIKALQNLKYYDLLANPDLLSQLAIVDKRFPEAPKVHGAAQLPDMSFETIPWLPDEARKAIETWARDGTLDLTSLLELVFAKLEGDVCDFVLSWIQGVFNWMEDDDMNVQTGLLDAIQSLESNDNLKSVLPTLRLRVVRNLSPKRHGEILVGLMESGGEDVATAAVERFAPPRSPGPFCFDPVLHRLTRRRHADCKDFREEAIPLFTERLVKALHRPFALKVLLAGLDGGKAAPPWKMEEALLPLVGTLIQQLQGGDAATHTRQLVKALPRFGCSACQRSSRCFPTSLR